jgi:hypothetical protein
VGCDGSTGVCVSGWLKKVRAQEQPDNAGRGEYKTILVAITVSANGDRANQTGFYLDGSSMKRQTHRDSEVLPT